MKTRILVVLSAVTLLALIAIQGYLIYNSYELKQKTITIDARNAIARVYNTPRVDSIAWLYRTDFLRHLEAYKRGEITNSLLLKKLEQKAHEINPGFMQSLNEGLAAYNNDFDIKFKKVVISIALTDSLNHTEMIYPEDASGSLVLLGQNFEGEEGLLINNSSWQKDHEITIDGVPQVFDLDFKSSIYMSISNWDTLLLQELSGLLLGATLLFLFVVGLLYYSIRNLMKQKRLAEIKTDFINNITHELKTPLSTLSLATKTLTSEHAKGDANMTAEAIQVIERQNLRLQKLIDQVLKSSLGYQEIQLNTDSFNVTVFLNELLDDYVLSLDKHIEIDRQIENTGISLSGDKFYISTAIINILNNAVKYGGTRLEVRYSIDTAQNQHLISIVDNGIGIAPKYQKYIFEKFFRVSEKDTHNYKGLGLGLYYTSQIIKAHNGTIGVSSEINKGTKFIINIPVV